MCVSPCWRRNVPFGPKAGPQCHQMSSHYQVKLFGTHIMFRLAARCIAHSLAATLTTHSRITSFARPMVTSAAAPEVLLFIGEDLHDMMCKPCIGGWDLYMTTVPVRSVAQSSNHCCLQVGKNPSSFPMDSPLSYLKSGLTVKQRHVNVRPHENPPDWRVCHAVLKFHLFCHAFPHTCACTHRCHRWPALTTHNSKPCSCRCPAVKFPDFTRTTYSSLEKICCDPNLEGTLKP